jgi:hypothetical protein
LLEEDTSEDEDFRIGVQLSKDNDRMNSFVLIKVIKKDDYENSEYAVEKEVEFGNILCYCEDEVNEIGEFFLVERAGGKLELII